MAADFGNTALALPSLFARYQHVVTGSLGRAQLRGEAHQEGSYALILGEVEHEPVGRRWRFVRVGKPAGVDADSAPRGERLREHAPVLGPRLQWVDRAGGDFGDQAVLVVSNRFRIRAFIRALELSKPIPVELPRVAGAGGFENFQQAAVGFGGMVFGHGGKDHLTAG